MNELIRYNAEGLENFPVILDKKSNMHFLHIANSVLLLQKMQQLPA
jgi:hypothetical protein